jgi:tetratricopeptide (TPR) repeat protein
VAPWNFQTGDAELRRALELSPSLGLARQYLGFSFLRQGRLDESLTEFLKARELDPLSSISARGVSASYYLKRDYAQALTLLRQANELGPGFTAPWEIGIYVESHLANEALAELEQAKRDRKDDPMLIYSTGMAYAAQQKRSQALQIISQLKEISSPGLSQALWIAKIYAALDEKEETLAWLERGLAAGEIAIFYKDEPLWDGIRRDPRFADLVRKMGATP